MERCRTTLCFSVLELILTVCILGLIAGLLYPVLLIPGYHHHRPRPVKEQEILGYWVSIPGAHSAYRLFLTNGGSGMLGVRDIYTDLWSVVSWQVTNRDLSIDLAPITHPEWSHEYIRGTVVWSGSEIRAVRGGENQRGERYKVEMIFYREDALRRAMDAASAVMTNHSKIIDSANGNQPFRSETNSP